MSKKNRHKSRPAQRPPAPPKADAAAIVADGAADAPVADVAQHDAPQDLAGHAAVAVPVVEGQGLEPADDAAPLDGAPGAGPAAATVYPYVNAGALDDAAVAGSAPASLPSAPPTPVPMASSGDIRGVLIQVAGARLLMPNATIAEVLSYADPEPVGESAPAWLLGRLRWRGWQVPLVAFGTLAGVAEERAALGSKVIVLKALAGTSRTPYFAILTQGFPRLVTVSRQALAVEDHDAATMPRGVQARVRLNEDPALLPDLEAIEALIADAVAQAA